jgi:hypothetical protein
LSLLWALVVLAALLDLLLSLITALLVHKVEIQLLGLLRPLMAAAVAGVEILVQVPLAAVLVAELCLPVR